MRRDAVPPLRRAIAAMRKEGIVVGAVAVAADGNVTIYQQDGIAAPAKWLDVEA